jgi:UDPglucose--hexose-1-phosphate uridylyltransferase
VAKMLNKTIEKLLIYASFHLDLSNEDVIYVRNILLDLLHQDSPFEGEINISELKGLKVPDLIIKELHAELKKNKFGDDGEIDRLIVRIMGLVTPLPSAVIKKFSDLYRKNKVKAVDYLYDLEIKNDYIQKSKVDQNLLWTTSFPKNNLEITINLSKPEKDNKTIALSRKQKENFAYPQCLLCKENEGYGGRNNHPARGNIRLIPLRLDDEIWYLQYSPYVYYDRHCIVFEGVHEPMTISHRTLSKLFAFVDQFPNFFIGSNSDLPIVGGSILNHEHFQGGAHEMPLMRAPIRKNIHLRREHRVSLSILDWYNSVLLLKSRNKQALLSVAYPIIDAWRNYSDVDADIIAKEGEDQHNTVTPIVRKIGSTYHMYIILRNNRTDKNYPDGIFHAHPEYHHIKKEGIGLIEAMGLFILPARLKRQLEEIETFFVEKKQSVSDFVEQRPEYEAFKSLLKQMDSLAPETNYHNYLIEHINTTCQGILDNTAVFKSTEKGQEAFLKFIKTLSI